MPKTKSKIDDKMSILLRTLHQENGVSCYELVKRYGKQYAERSIYRHAKKPLQESTVDKRKYNKGRPRKLTPRMERIIIRTVVRLRKERREFTSRKIQEVAGVGKLVNNRDIRTCLRKNGFSYCQSRKKGLVTERDKVKRLKFARENVNKPVQYWTEEIDFYLDGIGFAHKRHPAGEARAVSSMTWRRKQEGLVITTKGRKEGSGGKMAKFFVAISYGKGVVMCHHHEWEITGANFAEYIIRKQFPLAFKKAGSSPPYKFLQDGCPRQNSKVAQRAWEKKKYEMVGIPARSPDLNPIENFFNLVRKKLKADAIEKDIKTEDYESFVNRIKETITTGIPISTIDNLISSMPKRMALVIKGKGNRTKY